MTVGKPVIRVMIVDDYELMRQVLGIAIDSFDDMKVIAEATNGLEAVETYGNHLPDVLLMDVEMPIMNGLTAMQNILNHFPAACIIIMTGMGDLHNYDRQAVEAGARACLNKHGAYTNLADRIRQVHEDHIAGN
jgi:two-component system invasion response regulator UvrY